VKADVKNKTVTTNNGDVFQYGTLLVATGSTVSVLSLLIVATLEFQYVS
jgi:NADH dehydrogenase FAD-containing subunit